MTIVTEEKGEVLDSKSTELLVLEFIINDIIDSVGEEVMRDKSGKYLDPEEVEWETDEAIRNHQETSEPELLIPDDKIEPFRQLLYDYMFSKPLFAQGDLISVKKEFQGTSEHYFSMDSDVFSKGKLTVSKTIGRLVKIKNKSKKATSSAYYLDYWFTKKNTKEDTEVNQVEINKLKELPHMFRNDIVSMYEDQLTPLTVADIGIGSSLIHKETKISYIVSSINHQDSLIELHGTEHKGNWHALTDFEKPKWSALTKDLQEVEVGNLISPIIGLVDGVMISFGWSTKNESGLNTAFYKYRQAVVQTTFKVVGIGNKGHVYVVPELGPLVDILGKEDFCMKTLADYFVKDRTKYYDKLRTENSNQGTQYTYSSFQDNTAKRKEEEENRKVEEDKAKGPYKLDKFKNKLVRIRWAGSVLDGDSALVSHIDEQLGRIHLRINEGRKYDTYYFRASQGEDKYIKITGDVIFTDEA